TSLHSTLSLHDALPILASDGNAVPHLLIRPNVKEGFLIRLGGFLGNFLRGLFNMAAVAGDQDFFVLRHVITPMMFSSKAIGSLRSEEHTSELQSRFDIV